MPNIGKPIKRVKDAPESKILQIKREAAPAFRTVYSNNVQIVVNYFDIKVQFGQAVLASEDEGVLHVSDEVAVYMSPEHAKSLYEVLGRQLDLYRQKFGELRPQPLPDDSDTAPID